MPMPPRVLAHMLVIMHALSALPHLDPPSGTNTLSSAAIAGGGARGLLSATVGSAAGSGSGSGCAIVGASTYCPPEGGGLAAVASAASQAHELARTRREIDCAFR